MEPPINNGYLVLADLSGYTSFLAETEFDHGPNILHDLITMIIDGLTPTLHLAEVEGDAVFVYAPASHIPRGELLLELIESMYFRFRNRQRSMMHNATCPCKACRSISQLDLKFITHYGPYVLQEVAGSKKPVGTCVNLAHRLMKNNVSKATGWTSYALFSERCLNQMGIDPEGAHHEVEHYEHLGDVRTISTNLDARYRELIETHRDVLTAEEADVVLPFVFQAPAPLVWDWLHDPHKRALWFEGSAWAAKERPQGRTGAASQNHCANSGFIEHVLDWRPFDYYTVRLLLSKLAFKITGTLEPDGEQTHLHWHLRMDHGLPDWPRRSFSRLFAMKAMRMQRNFERMNSLIMAEQRTAETGAHAEPVQA